MKKLAETDRLILREILPTDLDAMFELHSDPEVHTFLGNKTITSRAEALHLIHFVRQQYINFGIGRWAVVDKKTSKFMGWTGLEFVTESINNHTHYYDLGYRLLKKHWGQGIATESAFASLEYAFDQLNIEEVFARADSNNIGSNNVLEKVGMKYIEPFDLDGVQHNWYKINKATFKTKKPDDHR